MAWSSPRTWVTSEVVTAAHMNQEIRDNLLAIVPSGVTAASWTPVLQTTGANPITPPTPTGRQYRIGAFQSVWVRYSFGSGGGGTYFVELPVAASGIPASASSGQGTTIGSWSARDDSSTGNNESGSVTLRSSTTVHFQRSAGGVVQGEGPPFDFMAGDNLSFHAVYPVA